MRKIIRVGVDLAKNVIQVHAVDEHGTVVVARALRREKFITWCVQLPAGCLIAMEACSGAHHWCHKLQALGFDARMIPAQFVAPYRIQGNSGKNDANDAAAVCEAASRAHMRWCDERIAAHHQSDERVQRAAQLMGVGPVTASALIATVGDFNQFKNGAQLGAWLGLVPKQNSSGGVARLGGITKRGDIYLRTLLIQGAKAVVLTGKQCTNNPIGQWAQSLRQRSNWYKAVVALANKNARILWAIMTRGENFDACHVSTKHVRMTRPAI